MSSPSTSTGSGSVPGSTPESRPSLQSTPCPSSTHDTQTTDIDPAQQRQPLYDPALAAAAAAKSESHYIDPCQEAADKSLRCLRRNGGDRKMCQDFFTDYRNCKEKWIEEMRELKRIQRKKATEEWMKWLKGG